VVLGLGSRSGAWCYWSLAQHDSRAHNIRNVHILGGFMLEPANLTGVELSADLNLA
jgi:hypothetical protein